MLLLTNCEVHTAKYSEGLTYGPNDMSTAKIRSEYFPYGTNDWLIRVLFYSHHELVEKFSESCWDMFGKLTKYHSKPITT